MKLLSIGLALFGVLVALGEVSRVTPKEFGGAKQPQIAVGENGELYSVFGKEETVYFARSSNGGRTFTPPMAIGVLDKLALGMRRGPRIAAAGKTITVTAISHAQGNLYSWLSKDGGDSWTEPVVINSVTNSAREGLHALAGDGDAKLISVWLDLRNGKTGLWSSVSENGGETWGENRRVYKSPAGSICECCHPSAVFHSTGEIVVMWRNWLDGSRDMYRAASADGGKTFSTARKIGPGTWRLAACPMDGGSIAVNGEETSYVWRREGKLFVTNGPSTERLLAESGTQPVVVRNAKGFSWLWQDKGNLYWKPSAVAPAQILGEKAGYGAAVWSPREGKAFVVWEGEDGIYVWSKGR